VCGWSGFNVSRIFVTKKNARSVAKKSFDFNVNCFYVELDFVAGYFLLLVLFLFVKDKIQEQ
jgi:hypothetical protein